jgi:autotransporter translocation and assembly factor TamB
LDNTSPTRVLPRPARWLLIATLLLPILLLAVFAAALGLVGSEAGTAWLAARAAPQLAEQLRWQTVQGTLLGRLQLNGISAQQPGLAVKARSLVLAWQPAALLQGELAVTALEVEGVELTLSEAPDTAPGDDSAPFSPGDLRLPLALSLRGVAIRDVRLQLPDAAPQRIDAITLEARLDGEQLELTQVQLRMPQGGGQLSARASLREQMPFALSAQGDWQLASGTPDSGGSTAAPLSAELTLEGEWDWRQLAVALDYELAVAGVETLSPELPARLRARGRVEAQMEPDSGAASLEQLSLQLATTPLELTLSGELTPGPSGAPAVDGKLSWQGAQWPLQGDAPLIDSAEGTLTIAGTTEDYRLRLATSLGGAQLPASRWQAQAQGTASSLDIERLRGTLLGGAIELRGPVGWAPQPHWQLQLAVNDVDPGELLPELAGPVQAQLDTRGSLDADGAVEAQVAIGELSAQLMGNPLTVRGGAALRGESLTLDGLALRSGGSRIEVSGQLSESALALDWQLDIQEPQRFLPAAAAQLRGEGHLSGTPESPLIEARLEGQGLSFDTLSADALSLQLHAGLAADAPLALTLRVDAIGEGDSTLVEGLTINASGETGQHRIELALRAPEASAEARLRGGLDVQTLAWSGALAQLAAQLAPVGRWTLAEAAGLAVSAQDARLERACLQRTSEGGELCLAAGWQSAADTALELSLEALPLAGFLPDVTGMLGGELRGALAADGELSAAGHFALSPGQLSLPAGMQARALAHGGGTLDLRIDAQGLAASVHVDAPEQGVIDGTLRLPGMRTLTPAPDTPLTGSLAAELPDLGIVAAWVEELGSSAGRVSADIQLGGTLSAPALEGGFRLSEGAASVPLAGLELAQIELDARADPAQPGHVNLSGGLSSGGERLRLAGSIDATAAEAELTLQAQRLLVFDTPDARVRISPDLRLRWSDGLLQVAGLVQVPRAEITPRLRFGAGDGTDAAAPTLPGAVIAPSADVVVVGEQQLVAQADGDALPLRIDANIGLLFGERVEVNALGLISRIEGAVGFTLKPDQAELLPRAQGVVSLREGTFRSFGQDLDIETGQLIFADVPVTEPEVYLRAVRWIDNDPEVSAAGVILSGSGTAPQLELFSRPQLEPAEIQSYLLTGTATGSRRSVVGIGTYLNERIYVGYGYNLLEETSEFDALFSITPRYGLGVDAGEADSNVNLTFTLER